MTVFSNFRADELELDAGAKHGVRALKNLLKYAETRELECSVETGKATDSPFEDQVMRALQERGYSVEPQVGTAGYFIDLAVRDPELPGRYLLAIECDGAAYHSAKSARDRDRLRQGVLEGLGWRFHRIWSTDWFRNAGHETDRVIDAIKAAQASFEAAAESAQLPKASSPERTEASARIELDREAADLSEASLRATRYVSVELPVQKDGNDIASAPLNTLRELVTAVVDGEAPVSVEIIGRRLMAAFGVSRAGARVVARIKDAVDASMTEHAYVLQDEGFIIRPEQLDGSVPITVRDRSSLPTAERKIELIAPEEIRAALVQTTLLAFSISSAHLIAEVARQLGFNRASANITARIEAQLGVLLARQTLSPIDDGRIAIAQPG
ncbi:DUF3320 domain-containing protein [Achromobacter sp. Root565]|uniref:DUF3320 domain-containing protein n=1 Tax=Achromobacter sp. Root565 TaxID=1736564 RepID=UPI000701C05C|nr:DUF3320 domain-containing protein [Achromobacter sp. Root565]KRA02098.1 hypothetical protein ASD71_08635 [Achromobacter sp. Root565]